MADGFSKSRLASWAKKIQGRTIAVVGDLLVDEYIFGNTERVSREAPVLILKYDYREIVPGGAANAVHNVRSVGGLPVPVGVVGEDEAGRSLLRLFAGWGIPTWGIVVSPEVPTITKTRVMAGGYHTSRQQLMRIDREHGDRYPRSVVKALTVNAARALAACDGVLFSDYGYGVLGAEVRAFALAQARRRRKPTVVDSRYRLSAFRGVTTATPNEVEVAGAVGTGLDHGREGGLDRASRKVMATMGLTGGLIVTRGRLGMRVYPKSRGPVSLPIVGSDEVADVTGAGDTVSGVVSLALAAGLSVLQAAHLATYAASVVVMKRGTATVSQAELLRAIRGSRHTAVRTSRRG